MELSPSEAVKIRELLRAPFVVRWFEVCMANRPSLGTEKTIEGQALKSREAKGWEDALHFMQEVARTSREAPPAHGESINFSQEK